MIARLLYAVFIYLSCILCRWFELLFKTRWSYFGKLLYQVEESRRLKWGCFRKWLLSVCVTSTGGSAKTLTFRPQTGLHKAQVHIMFDSNKLQIHNSAQWDSNKENTVSEWWDTSLPAPMTCEEYVDRLAWTAQLADSHIFLKNVSQDKAANSKMLVLLTPTCSNLFHTCCSFSCWMSV